MPSPICRMAVLKFKLTVTVSLPHSSQGSFCPFIYPTNFCKHIAICLQEAIQGKTAIKHTGSQIPLLISGNF